MPTAQSFFVWVVMIGPEMRFLSITSRKKPRSPLPNEPERPLCEKAACKRLMLTLVVLSGSALAPD